MNPAEAFANFAAVINGRAPFGYAVDLHEHDVTRRAVNGVMVTRTVICRRPEFRWGGVDEPPQNRNSVNDHDGCESPTGSSHPSLNCTQPRKESSSLMCDHDKFYDEPGVTPSQEAIELLTRRYRIRHLNADQFITGHASGTLRKNKRLGMRWRDQYLVERTAYEFGFGFECAPRSRVMQGEAYTEGDCHAITEAGWHMERYIALSIFPRDVYAVRYINVEWPDGSRREGLGLVVERTDAPFVPTSHIVFAIISEYDPQRRAWREPLNPF